jgi:hypothetical protein
MSSQLIAGDLERVLDGIRYAQHTEKDTHDHRNRKCPEAKSRLA